MCTIKIKLRSYCIYCIDSRGKIAWENISFYQDQSRGSRDAAYYTYNCNCMADVQACVTMHVRASFYYAFVHRNTNHVIKISNTSYTYIIVYL